MNNVRVLIINIQIGSGSAGTIVSDLYYGMLNKGYECKIAYSRGETKTIPAEHTYKIGNKIDILYHAGLTRLFGNTASYSKIATKIFLKRINEYKPDIIHIHGLYGYYINMKMLFDHIRTHNIALVTTLHSCWDFTGHCCYFDYIQCTKWKDNCAKCPQKSSYPTSSFLDPTKKNLLHKKELYHSIPRVKLVSPSAWMDTLVDESCLGDIDHLVIHNGIDLERFHPRVDYSFIYSLGINDELPTVLAVASLWDHRKGYEDIIELAKVLDNRMNIVVVGLSDRQIREKPNSIIGLRRTDNIDQLISLYTYSTVLFNPTYEDNYPTVNLEAIACHTPVITYNTGGSPECIMNGKYGMTICKKDYDSLINIVYAIKNGVYHFYFDDLYDISKEKMISRYLDLYSEITITNK